MAQADLDGPSVASANPPVRRTRVWVRVLVLMALVPFLGFLGVKTRTLWDEWSGLQGDQSGARSSAVIGYLDINPNPSLAGRPEDWVHDEGDQTFVWAGYRNARHRWFHFAKGDFEVERLSLPIGRDTIRAIDQPIFERKGEVRWDRVPDEASVVGLDQGEDPAAYPIRVMDKVMIVNDQINQRPTLAVYSPIENIVSFYQGEQEGQRIVMGHCGYFIDHEPLLFDRRTESLWLADDESLLAVAGALKGTRLARLARVVPEAWSNWRGRHPGSRLLIGADRSKAHSSPPAP